MRIVLLSAALLALAIGSVACSKDGGPTTPTPPKTGSEVVYSAVGASDVMGIGSSAPCIAFNDCNGNGYVPGIGRLLRAQGFTVRTKPLGWPGSVISRRFLDLSLQYGRRVDFNITDSMAPFVDDDATLVTVFTGVNDVNVITHTMGLGAGASNPLGYIDDKVTEFGQDYDALLAVIRGKARNAKVVAFNLPNVGAMPFLATASLLQKQAAQRASVRMTTNVINRLSNVTVVDLMCDPRFYQAAYFSTDGLHPSDAGYTAMATEVVRALTSPSYPSPSSSCSQMAIY